MVKPLLQDEQFTAQMLAWTSRANITIQSNRAETLLKGPLSSPAYLELRGTVKDCDSDIATIDAILNELSEKKQILQRFSDTYKPFAAAHRRLPQEILQEIFMQCMESSSSPACITSNMKIALRVSWVSSSCMLQYLLFFISLLNMYIGRQAATTKPLLWSSIRIVGKGKCELLSLFLRRSKSQSLCIDIATSHLDNADYTEEITLIVPYCSRWRILRLNVRPKSLERLEGVKNKMPRLESVAFRSTVEPPVSFTNAPKLRKIDLSCGPHTSSSNLGYPTDRLPWAQLTTCFAGKCTTYEVVEILRECRNLSVFDFYLVDREDNAPHPPNVAMPVTSETLQVLRVNADVECGFYELVTAPSLTTLRHCDEMAVTSSDVFIEFLERSNCVVRTLHLAMYWEILWDPSEWIDLLETVPSLTTLIIPYQTIDLFRMPEAFARIGHPSPSEEILLPQMEIMVVSIDSIDYSFVEMIHSRQSAVGSTSGPDCRLQSLYLNSVVGADEGALELLYRLKKDGLYVSIVGSLKLDPKFGFDEVAWDDKDSEDIGEQFY